MKPIFKNLFLIILNITFILMFIPSSFAGPATVYKVTLSRFELNNGTSWITVFDGTSASIDIAAVSGSGSAGNFLSGLAVPDGTYTQVRVTPSATFTIRGNDGSSYTTATIGSGGGCTVGNASQVAECTLTISPAPSAKTEDFSGTPVTVTDGVANHKVRVSFDVSNAIQLQGAPGNQELFPAAPSVTLSIQ